MGIQFKATCGCGYTGITSVGSSRAMHGKVSDFPHRCNQCREAVSVDLLADPICCPKCGGNDIVSYAAKTKCASPWMLRLISNHWLAKLGYHTPTEEQHGDYCYPLDRHSAILWGKHPCPKCNAQGLQFSVHMMFD